MVLFGASGDLTSRLLIPAIAQLAAAKLLPAGFTIVGSANTDRNALHVDHVDISWLESLTLEGRASYYDRAGAMKDMVQNHLMEAMALVLMDQPARIDADSFRGVRVEGLRAVATPAAETMRSQTVRKALAADSAEICGRRGPH